MTDQDTPLAPALAGPVPLLLRAAVELAFIWWIGEGIDAAAATSGIPFLGFLGLPLCSALFVLRETRSGPRASEVPCPF